MLILSKSHASLKFTTNNLVEAAFDKWRQLMKIKIQRRGEIKYYFFIFLLSKSFLIKR